MESKSVLGDLPQNKKNKQSYLEESDKEREKPPNKKKRKREKGKQEKKGNVKESAWNGIMQFVFA